MKTYFALMILLFSGYNFLVAQSTDLYTNPKIIGWQDNTHYLLQKYNSEKKPYIESVDVKTGKSIIVQKIKSDREKMDESLPEGTKLGRTDILSPDGKTAIIFKENDLFSFTLGEKESIRLTNDSVPEMNARCSPDGNKIAYTKKRDMYVFDRVLNKEIRLTFDATDKIYNGWSSWVYMEEILGRASRYAAFWWSPDSKKIAYFRFDDNPVPVFTLNRLDDADGTHGTPEITPYPKPGDYNPVVKAAIVDIESGKTNWVKTDEMVDQYFGWPFWSPDGKKFAIQLLNRDQNVLKIMLSDIENGELKEIYRENRKTWVDFFEDIYVLKQGRGFILRSARNDWENLYLYSWEGSLIKQLTNVPWRITEIDHVDELTGIIYFKGTGMESTDLHLFRVNLDGKNFLQLTSEPGTHQVQLSPNGNYFADTWSRFDSPGSILIIDKNGKQQRIACKPEEIKFDTLRYVRSELVRIKTKDELFSLPAMISYPLHFDRNRKYPVVFTIYGGPNAQGVYNTWRGNVSWYAENDIITISVDHRGSGHFGKRGLDYLHRNLGYWEISDYSDVVCWLKEKPFIDSTRIGITGSSYGGYITCLAMTKGAGYWTHGIAGSSVTDWKLYDNVYTERYMDTPQDNSTGYKESSVLNYVSSFNGKLLITHGDLDDNVHLQNSIQLISKLQDAGKSFEFMLYPGGRHGWGGAKRIHSTNLYHNFWMRYFFNK